MPAEAAGPKDAAAAEGTVSWPAQRRWNSANKQYFAERMRSKYQTDAEFRKIHIARVLKSRQRRMEGLCVAA
jgi:predicted NAD-dependent protein-ADP-ribosyltransferase YbiA (DUF1768 family)